ncbi:hypothetical protein K474DRAFT_590296 [Panus rudis PR-1116 ss-1]|nr:hypothetical protein K474DRAFT_590296 [Panus rudis PR-1116 ss-1]
MGKRSRGAAMGLLFYDHMLNLSMEVELIWKQSKRRPAFYLPSHKIRDRQFTSILQLRVYALYDRSRKILVFLLALCAAEVATMAVLVGVTIGHLEHLPIASTDTGCFYKGILSLSALFWVPGLIYEPVLFVLVAYKAWPRRRNGPRIPLVTRIARDSLLYFVLVFAELLISTMVWARAPTYINLVMPWSAALPSILGSRLLLNMREMVSRQGNKSYIVETFGPADTIPFRHTFSTDNTEESELTTIRNITQ